ncbi:MAG TPA: HAMP domain-containing histidine kinase, partial [Spirochaetia bacterium]|nr:HAMP domain-containing histidine kinase [Spirochaetia bacterium]
YNIKRKAGQAPIEKHLRTVESKIAESEQIINNLLFYARLKAPRKEPVDIRTTLEECVSMTAQKAPRTVSISLSPPTLNKGPIQADPIQIREVFNNILGNAVDAVSMAEKEGRIEITIEEDHTGSIRLRFSDNGPGIEKETLRKIFDPFFTTKTKGTGLGLSICSQIVGTHGGRLEVESAPGQGTAVILTLPRA